MADREFVLEVIEKYKELPCLWQISNPNYHNKMHRQAAMEQLILLFQTKDPAANKDTVQKKINSLRNCLKKELNKVKATLRSGAGTDDVHVPKLWYYDQMLFLEDQDKPRTSSSIHSIFDDMAFGYDNENNESETVMSPPPPSPKSSASSALSGFKRTKTKADAVLDKISQHLGSHEVSQGSKQISKQKYDSFGEHVAEKLNALPEKMLPYCQKTISDALFYPYIGHLNVTSGIVTDFITENANVDRSKKAGTENITTDHIIISAYNHAMN